MNITFPDNTKPIIDAIRHAVGRVVSFYINTPTECSGCSLDPVTDTSTNPYCPICSGLHYIPTYSGVSISGHITWNPAETMYWVSAGQYDLGDCRVQIEYTPTTIDVVARAEYLMVDGKRCTIKNKIYRGTPELNRILLNCIEEE